MYAYIYATCYTAPSGMRWGLFNEYTFELNSEVISSNMLVEASLRHTLKSQDHVRVGITLKFHNVPKRHRSAAMTEGFGPSGT